MQGSLISMWLFTWKDASDGGVKPFGLTCLGYAHDNRAAATQQDSFRAKLA